MWTVSPQRWSPETDRQRRWVPLRRAGYVMQSFWGLGSCPGRKIIHFWAYVTRKGRLEAPEEWKHSTFFLQKLHFFKPSQWEDLSLGGNLPDLWLASEHSPWNVQFLEFNLAGISAWSGIVYRNVEVAVLFAACLHSSSVILELREPQPWVPIWEQGQDAVKMFFSAGLICSSLMLLSLWCCEVPWSLISVVRACSYWCCWLYRSNLIFLKILFFRKASVPACHLP